MTTGSGGSGNEGFDLGMGSRRHGAAGRRGNFESVCGTSVACARLKLWDEVQRRLVRFPA